MGVLDFWPESRAGGILNCMGVARSEVPTRLRRKVCLDCGYRGRELQGLRGESTFICPRCLADLYSRPPRTYAEMEGLEEAVGGLAEPALPVWFAAAAERRRHSRPRTLAGRLLLGLSLPVAAIVTGVRTCLGWTGRVGPRQS